MIEVFLTFLKLGLTSFGGPIAHIGYFRAELVNKRQWITESQFSELFAICQFLPGPASSQLGFALGLLRAGWQGAFAAFIAFTLPSALFLIAFASLLPYLASDVGQAIIHGLKLVALVVVADAVINMFQKLCKQWATRFIALAALISLLALNDSWLQLAVIAGGALLGIMICQPQPIQTISDIKVHYGKKFALLLLATFGFLLFISILPTQNTHMSIGQIFYRAGALVFGGGHVVLPLLQDAVVSNGMLSQETFLAGYGATQAIPGPMFSFSAYLGAMMPHEMQINWLNAALALIAIFLPGFLLISAALPIWQRLSSNPIAGKAITGINAAVIGLLTAALYNPIFTSSVHSIGDLLVGTIGLAMLLIWRLSPLWVIATCVLGSLLISTISFG